MDNRIPEEASPPEAPPPLENILIVEQVSGGWVVRDQLGLKGGVFRCFSSAVHYAKYEARAARTRFLVREAPRYFDRDESVADTQSRAVAEASVIPVSPAEKD